MTPEYETLAGALLGFDQNTEELIVELVKRGVLIEQNGSDDLPTDTSVYRRFVTLWHTFDRPTATVVAVFEKEPPGL